MPRFVVLQHDHPYLHWDFMLESGGALRTWRLTSPPQPDLLITATPLGEHRLAYLDYEGPLSGNRGNVVRWDRGDYEMVQDSGSHIIIKLQGEKTRGIAALSRSDADEWSMTLRAAP
jgi:hypothetical protein